MNDEQQQAYFADMDKLEQLFKDAKLAIAHYQNMLTPGLIEFVQALAEEYKKENNA